MLHCRVCSSRNASCTVLSFSYDDRDPHEHHATELTALGVEWTKYHVFRRSFTLIDLPEDAT